MEDKAVSTEDLCTLDYRRKVAVSLARLEVILQTLVENKVEALKNDNRKHLSAHSKSKRILKRLRLSSTSSHSTTKNEEDNEKHGNIEIVNEKKTVPVASENLVIKSALKKESSMSSVGSQHPQYQYRMPSFETSSVISDEDRNRSVQYDNIDSGSQSERPPSCCCSHDLEGQAMPFDDDYISLKLDGFPDHIETDAIMSQEAMRRARRKRRKRRKRKMKKQMAIAQHEYLVETGVINEDYKKFTVEDSTKKAKWTIVATAFLLLFMCLLLVGITLRMAPIIDEMVRKENEEFVNSLSKHKNVSVGMSVQLNNT